MNGPIAQIVALTCYGNAILSGEPVQPFFPANSTCQFCERATFVTLGRSLLGKPRQTELADSPDAWFSHLQASGARGVRLSQTPQNHPSISDRMSAGLVGGGRTWTMEILFPEKTSQFWMASWELGNQKSLDNRIWRVVYGRVSRRKSNPSTLPELPPAVLLSPVVHELNESLQEIRAFSAKHSLDAFTRCFDDALDTIETKGQNRHGYHHDLAPAGFLSEEAAMLLDACQSAWVFGGMGSWNDLGFAGEDQLIYQRVSERLFQVVNMAIEQAATSTIPNRKPEAE